MIGIETVYIDQSGSPSLDITPWCASALVIFGRAVLVWGARRV